MFLGTSCGGCGRTSRSATGSLRIWWRPLLTGRRIRARAFVRRTGGCWGRPRDGAGRALPQGGSGAQPSVSLRVAPELRHRLGEVPALATDPLAAGEGLDVPGWAAAEFGGAPLGDARLVAIAAALGADPMASFPAAAKGSRAQVKAHYRFLDLPDATKLSPEAILCPHRERTVRRMRAEPVVLVHPGRHRPQLLDAAGLRGAGGDRDEPDGRADPGQMPPETARAAVVSCRPPDRRHRISR